MSCHWSKTNKILRFHKKFSISSKIKKISFEYTSGVTLPERLSIPSWKAYWIFDADNRLLMA